MKPATLRNVILTALASTTLGGGQSACGGSASGPQGQSFDLLVSPPAGPFTDSSTPPGEFYAYVTQGQPGSFSGDAAGWTRQETEDGLPFFVDDGETYEEWLAGLSQEPCIESCAVLVALLGAPYLPVAVPPPPLPEGETITSCAPISSGTRDLVVHCEWSEPAVSNPGGESSGGCLSLGKGRLPAGFVARAVRGSDARARFFATAAQLEAASVTSFARVARDLARHGAPAHLARAAMRARRDEIRHARVMSTFARHYGAIDLPRGAASPWRPRDLETIATENVVEGCVRETYGALDATWVARNARDPHVRAAMRRVARDETRHAALAWQIAEWSLGVLGRSVRRRIAEARRAAVSQLSRELVTTQAQVLIEAGLVPSAAERLTLLASLERGLATARSRGASSTICLSTCSRPFVPDTELKSYGFRRVGQ